MIKSMTGFGRSEIVKGNRKISVEIKSVNHRYLEAGIKMPKKLNVFESRMRDLLKKYATRGKIDIFINYEARLIYLLIMRMIQKVRLILSSTRI